MIRAALTLAASILSTSAVVAAESFNIDPGHTYPNFSVSHLGFSTMWGQFAKTSGTLSMDRAAGKLDADIVIDAASVYTGHGKRDDHLRSPDFFNVAEFPTLTFKSTGSKWTGEQLVEMTGNLTLLGVSKPITLAVSGFKCGTDPWKNYRCGADAKGAIKRSDFGMKYGLPGVGDDVTFMFEIEAVRKK